MYGSEPQVWLIAEGGPFWLHCLKWRGAQRGHRIPHSRYGIHTGSLQDGGNSRQNRPLNVSIECTWIFYSLQILVENKCLFHRHAPIKIVTTGSAEEGNVSFFILRKRRSQHGLFFFKGVLWGIRISCHPKAIAVYPGQRNSGGARQALRGCLKAHGELGEGVPRRRGRSHVSVFWKTEKHLSAKSTLRSQVSGFHLGYW